MRVSVVHNRRRFQDEHLDFNFSVNPAKQQFLLPPPPIKLKFDAIPNSVVLHRPVARRVDAAVRLPGFQDDLPPAPPSPTKLTVNFMLSQDPLHEKNSLERLSAERRFQVIPSMNQLLCETALDFKQMEAVGSEDLKNAVRG